jgi:hypothetical protein
MKLMKGYTFELRFSDTINVKAASEDEATERAREWLQFWAPIVGEVFTQSGRGRHFALRVETSPGPDLLHTH